MKTHEMIQSNYLKKEDVGEDGTIVTISGFDKVNVARADEPEDWKFTMSFGEFEKPMVLNATNIQLCEKALGSDDTDDWIGKQIIVYNEPNISFGNKLVGGIRVKAYRKAGAPRQVIRGTPKQPSVADINRDLTEAAGAGGEPDF
jgi:hypothetical protein